MKLFKILVHIFQILFLVLFIPVTVVYPDSPLTAILFHEAYEDMRIVKKAELNGLLDLEIAEFLSSPLNPIDVKAAVINALYSDSEGEENVKLYDAYLALRYKKDLDDFYYDLLTPDEIFCLGYLKAMDNYNYPEEAMSFLIEAKEKLKDSFTVSIILALTKAQKIMDSNRGYMWECVSEVFKDKSLKQDLRAEAKELIIDYMSGYEKDSSGPLVESDRKKITLILSTFCKLEDFSGDWTWAEIDEKGNYCSTFHLELKQQYNKVRGKYDATASYGNRLDCSSDEEEYNISGVVNGDVADVEFKSWYGKGMGGGSGKGRAKIVYMGDRIEWIVIKDPQNGWYYCPNKAVLKRSVVREMEKGF